MNNSHTSPPALIALTPATQLIKRTCALTLISSSLLLSACGGGDDASPSEPITNPLPSVIHASLNATSQGNETGPAHLVFTLSLTEANSSSAAISFNLSADSSSTASQGADYQAFDPVLTIPVGATSANLIVQVIDDNDIEPLETLTLNLSSAASNLVSININQGTASGVISDNDSQETAPSYSQSITPSSNSLRFTANIVTQAETQVQMQFSTQGMPAKLTPLSPLSHNHAFNLYGLRPETQYQVSGLIHLNTGEIVQTQAQTITTGALPAGLPTVQLVSHNAATSAGGLTFLSATDSDSRGFFALDETGSVVWYLDDDSINMSASPTIKSLGQGRLLLLLSREVRIIDMTGATISSFSLPAYHHDVQLLPSGNLIALITETRTVDGNLLQGDEIIEINPQGDIVWRWSALDNLDTDRFPGALAQRSLNNGALDWTHANALFYIKHDDSILFSSRSQSWVINIDKASGNIVWILGDNTGAKASLQDKFFTLESGSWQANQHAPMLTSVGDLLLYDNRNEAALSGASNNSRAVLYRLNTSQMQANQTWEAIAPKYTQSLGDVDELENGNILITAGGPGSNNDTHIVEVSSAVDSQVAWEIKLANTSVYRAERLSWDEFLLSSVATSVPSTDPIIDPKIDTANCQEARQFVDTNNSANYIDYDMDGRTNADIYGEEHAPSLSVSCDSDTLYIDTNGATNFDWVNLGQGNGGPQANNYHWVIPRNPELTTEQVAIPLLGPVAVTVTGIQIFGPNENGADNFADPVTDGLLNYCGGHTRDYHFHERAKCFFEYPTLGGASSLLAAQTPGVVLGYAFDGFPIMSPWECADVSCSSVIQINSSYRYTGSGDYSNENAWQSHVYEANLSPLDECNGMTRSDGSYAYYATETWPYYLSCYRGPTHLVGENNPRG